MNTPILETQRLLLRPFREGDGQEVFECWENDPDVAKYMFWSSRNDVSESIEWVKMEIGRIKKDDWYRFALVEKETGHLIGTGLVYYEEEISS
jgi:ribosomal-protein-alanine N-acetyltransferase